MCVMSGNPNESLADFVARILVHEGAWVIEPVNEHGDNLLSRFLDRIRFVPARISSPAGESRYAFAERGARGKWFFVWVPASRERVRS